jgi:hypothetical protein
MTGVEAALGFLFVGTVSTELLMHILGTVEQNRVYRGTEGRKSLLTRLGACQIAPFSAFAMGAT